MLIHCQIEGVSPLLMHKFSDEAQESATSGSRTSSAAGNRGTPLEQAAAVLYTDEGGNIIMPAVNITSTIVEAGKFFKIGRNKITTQKSSLLSSCVFLTESYYKLEHDEPWTVDSRPVRIPSTGGRIVRHRPRFDDWKISFDIDLDETELNVKLLREIVDASGKKVGLCDFRPSTKGPFGRFCVTSWEIDSESK
jgi:hypothetical protein